MKPAPFGYERPRDLKATLSLLAEAEASAKIIAGGQSLGPMLNLRLVEPQTIVDITALAELKQVERRGDELVLGACVTHADIEDGRIPDVTRGAMQGVAANIAYRAVRNRGTVGGSLSHADPAADWVSALSALGAKLTLRSSQARARSRWRISSSARWNRRCGPVRSWRRSMSRRCRHRRIGVTSRAAGRQASSRMRSARS